MTAFAFRAIDAAGRPVRGRREAADAAALRDHLLAESLTPLSIAPAAGAAGATGYRLSEAAAASLLAELARFLASGLSLGQALQVVETTSETPAAARLAARLRADLLAGVPLSQAIAIVPGQLGRFLASLARAGEATGKLAEIFAGGAKALASSAALKRRLVTMSLYPAFVLAMAGGAIALFAFAVLPALEPAFLSVGAKLPASTAFVLAAGHVLRDNAPYVAAVIAAVAALSFLAPIRRLAGRAIDTALASPLGLGIAQDTAFSGFAQRLAVALAAGVPLRLAYETAADAVGSARIRRGLMAQAPRLREGAKLSQALEATPATPRLLLGLVRVGETSADLPRAFAEAGDMLAARAHERTERALALVTPAIVLTVGLVVGTVVLVVFQGLLAITSGLDT
ncbi:MAG TPA: type II secretion system F family protein [Caulobacteraceae bacterium]|nr:type II secretion system F family protein [Caulobacteraceae bacterium]